ncbi:hypothetical protein AVEN_250656-1 [Araneus ventricosus]|uniref:BTB domain-containing protein n=1 Tax=Araneus ventricosus TaxID=182803 RepID=A0A4Y2V2U8_ARAVE|nr:hypothetical protein AVEN_249559-1 [Araneus ventricosus]GBO18081.1 hypothetical protein AVEN_250656-1 [Araneus ventricosus]
MQPGQKRSLLVLPLQMGAPKIELTLYLRQTSGEDNVLIEVKISDRKELHCVIAKISVVDADGRFSHTKGKGAIFIVEEDCLKFEPFVKKVELLTDESRYLINDVLFLKCELKTSFGVVLAGLENYGYGLSTTVESALPAKSTNDLKSSEEISSLYTSCSSDSLSNLENGNDCSEDCCSLCPLNIALHRLQKDGEIPDLRLTNGSRSFYVHRSILVENSPAFKKLIDENVTTKYFDLSTQYLHHILTYVYTGTVTY